MKKKKEENKTPDPKKKTTQLQVRISEYHLTRAKVLANKWAEGNLSNWVMYALFSAPRKHVPKDFKAR